MLRWQQNRVRTGKGDRKGNSGSEPFVTDSKSYSCGTEQRLTEGVTEKETARVLF